MNDAKNSHNEAKNLSSEMDSNKITIENDKISTENASKRGRPKKNSETSSRPYKFQRKRDGRIALSKTRKLGYAHKKEGLHYHWANESTTDFKELQDRGYTFINESDHDFRDVAMPSQDGHIIKRPVGGGEYAYLMAIPQEWYDEYEAAEQRENDEVMDQIGKTGLDCIPVDQQVGSVKLTTSTKIEGAVISKEDQ